MRWEPTHIIKLAMTCWPALLGVALAATTTRANEESEKAAAVPLKRLVLFNSGVGYFEHAGSVAGSAEVEFRFQTEDINDLLKSLVVRDLDGGSISTVSYASRDPLAKTLKAFAIDLTTNPSLADLLAQIRGERVEVDAPERIRGLIIGLEKRTVQIGEDRYQERNILNLLTEEGLRAIALESVGRIRLANPRLDAELRQALATLALGHDNEKKSVKLNFAGEGERRVRVGYVQETPVWKTSYRLALDEDGQAWLQGWAIVENTTDQDWENVSLTLMSGRPISFRMDLYQPLYLPRPEAELELFASLGPQVYSDDLMMDRAELVLESREALRRGREEPTAEAAGRGIRAFAAPPAATADSFAGKNAAAAEYFSQSVRSLAETGQVGELFQYVIQTPVSLARQTSAMLSIVNEPVEVEKISIYNSTVHAKHPLNGLRLKNSTTTYLMQGPLTIYDSGAYAGDAQIRDLPPGSDRLLSYAMDLNMEVAPTSTGRPEHLVSVRIAKGTLLTKRKFTRTQTYAVKNSGTESRKVLVEHPWDRAWTLVKPEEPKERTRDVYRFLVEASPDATEELKIEEERVVQESIVLTNLDDRRIAFYLQHASVGGAIKATLKHIVQKKRAIEEVVVSKRELEKQLKEITAEQNRIRENMGQLARDSSLYQRYVSKFADQEDQIEEHRAEIRRLAERERELRRDLESYLMNLDIS